MPKRPSGIDHGCCWALDQSIKIKGQLSSAQGDNVHPATCTHMKRVVIVIKGHLMPKKLNCCHRALGLQVKDIDQQQGMAWVEFVTTADLIQRDQINQASHLRHGK